MKFIDKYNNTNFNQLLASLINFNNIDNIHIAAPPRKPPPKRPGVSVTPVNITNVNSEIQRKLEEQKQLEEQTKQEELKKQLEEQKQKEDEQKETQPVAVQEPIIENNVLEQSTESTQKQEQNQSQSIEQEQSQSTEQNQLQQNLPAESTQPVHIIRVDKRTEESPTTLNQSSNNDTNSNNPNNIKPRLGPKSKNNNFNNIKKIQERIRTERNTNNTLPDSNIPVQTKPAKSSENESAPMSESILTPESVEKSVSKSTTKSENSFTQQSIPKSELDEIHISIENINKTGDANNQTLRDMLRDDTQVVQSWAEEDAFFGFNNNQESSDDPNTNNNQINDNEQANNENDNTESNINHDLHEIQDNLQSTTQQLVKLFTQSENFNDFVDFDTLTMESMESAITEEDKNVETMNEEITKALEEKAPEQTDDSNMSIGVTKEDEKILNALEQSNRINADTKTLVTSLSEIEIGHEETATNETETSKKKKITHNTSFESKLEQYNDKIESNKIKPDIEQFTNPEELKTYILQQCEEKKISTEIFNNPIKNIYTLLNAVSTLYKIAFNNENHVIADNAIKYNIKDILNKFIRNLYIDMFKPENLYNNPKLPIWSNKMLERFNEGQDPLLSTIEGIIKNRMDQNNHGRFNESITGKNNTPITLHQLINTCSMLYSINKRNNELSYNKNKSFDALLTEPLFELKQRDKNSALTNITFESTNINIFNKITQMQNSIQNSLNKMVTYTNNYCQNLNKLVLYKTNFSEIQDSTAKHHYFQRMSWKGFDLPLTWYRSQIDSVAYNMIEKIKSLSKVNRKTIYLYTNLRERLNCVYLYQEYIVPHLLKDIQKLKKARNLLKNYTFSNDIYNELYNDYNEHGAGFFRTSRIFNEIFNPDNKDIKPEWLDRYALKNQNFFKFHDSITAQRVNNRILRRIATNLASYNNLANDDNFTLYQFYQQPYAKYLISVLCNTDNLGKMQQWSWQDKRQDRAKFFLDVPKLKTYITDYLQKHKDQLENLQNEIINNMKYILHNNDKLFNILPKIDLLTNINNIAIINITTDSYENPDALYTTTGGYNSAPDLIKYIMWYFSRQNYINNSMLKQVFRRYILQPRIIEVLNQYVLQFIKQYNSDVSMNII